MNTIGDRLELLRGEADLTKVAMAAAGGTSKQHYGRIVSGQIQQPAPEWLAEWARHFRVNMEWLATGKGQRNAPASSNTSDWLPTMGYKQAAGLGHGQRADEWAEAHGLMFRRGFYTKIGATPAECAIFYGKGDSMFPTIQDGDAFHLSTPSMIQAPLRRGFCWLLGEAKRSLNTVKLSLP